MRHSICLVVVVFQFCLCAAAQETQPADNPELRELFQSDQAARSGNISPDLMVQDRQRRARAREIIDAGQMRTAADHFHAAMVFQHGEAPEDYKLAHELARKAAELDPSHRTAKWLGAAAMDRYLRSIGKPQIYGTQFMVLHDIMVLQPIDESAVTDEERKELGVPTLAAARQRVIEQNAKRQFAAEDNRQLDALLVEFVTEQVHASTPGNMEASPRMRELSRQAVAIVDAGEASTARDLASAVAMLEQFAETTDEYRRVLALAERARELSPDDPRLGVSYARAFDRLRVAEGKDQWYGTFARSPEKTASGRWEAPKVDPASTVTDEERARLGLPPLSAWQAMVDRLNREHEAQQPASQRSSEATGQA